MANNGIAGAQLVVQDNNTTGRFLNQSFSLEAIKLADGADPATAMTQLAERGVSFVLTDTPARVVGEDDLDAPDLNSPEPAETEKRRQCFALEGREDESIHRERTDQQERTRTGKPSLSIRN